MPLQFRPTSALFLIFFLAAPLSTAAQEPTLEEAAGGLTDRFREEALAYRFTYLASGKSLTLQPQPVLHWSNPARNGEDGLVFLWTDGGKPCAIGTFFTYIYRDEVRRKQSFRVSVGGHQDQYLQAAGLSTRAVYHVSR